LHEEITTGTILFGNLTETIGVAAGGATDNENDVGLFGEFFHGALAVCGGVADVFFLWEFEMGETSFEDGDDALDFVYAEGGLGDDGEAIVFGEDEGLGFFGGFDEDHPVGGFSHGAFGFDVAAVSDVDHQIAFVGEPLGFVVDFGDERAGGVDDGELAGLGLAADFGGDAVGTKDDDAAFGNVVDVFDEDDALLLEFPDHVFVVDDGMADIEGGAVHLEGELYDLDSVGDAGAKATRSSEDDLHRLG